MATLCLYCMCVTTLYEPRYINATVGDVGRNRNYYNIYTTIMLVLILRELLSEKRVVGQIDSGQRFACEKRVCSKLLLLWWCFFLFVFGVFGGLDLAPPRFIAHNDEDPLFL